MASKKLPEDPRDLYVYSDTDLSVREVAAYYEGIAGCSVDRLESRCTEEKWRDLRRNHRDIVAEKVAEKTAEKMAERKSAKLSDLNDQAIKRTETLIKISESKIKEHIEGDKITLSAKDIRTLTQNIIDLQHEIRLYNNFNPKDPVNEPPPPPEDPNKIDLGPDPLIGALEISAKLDWADYDMTQEEADEAEDA
jgi:hypothetical protein